MFFFPQDELKRNQAKNIFEVIVGKRRNGIPGLARSTGTSGCAWKSCSRVYAMHHAGIYQRPEKVEKGIDFDRRLYVVRRVFEQSSDDTYVASLSSRTIAYKGMFLVDQLRLFLQIFRIRIMNLPLHWFIPDSVRNTNPSWERAHPNRFIVHNGEINTIRGNRDKMQARGKYGI